MSSAGQPPPQIQVRTYTGKGAQHSFQLDAARMSQISWFPIGQTWVEGERSTGLLIVGVIGLLFVLVPGILILIGWAVYRGPGSLTVTYQFRPQAG